MYALPTISQNVTRGKVFSGGGLGGYLFAFNGKEGVDEVYGDNNFYEYKFRDYDPRIGRFISADPKASYYPWYSPYQFAGNKPIWCIDIDGAEDGIATTLMQNNWERDDQLFKEGKISAQEYQDRRYRSQMAYGIGGVAGAIGAGAVYMTPELIAATPTIARVSSRYIRSAYKSPVGKYIRERTKDAMIDFSAQFIANEGDINKVDWTGVASNYATPYKGSTGFILNNTLKNSLDAAVDYTFKDGLQFIGGAGNYNKAGADVAIDFFVGQLVDNLSGGYKAYLEEKFKNLDKDIIAKKVKEFGTTAKEYLENRIKMELGESGKKSAGKKAQ